MGGGGGRGVVMGYIVQCVVSQCLCKVLMSKLLLLFLIYWGVFELKESNLDLQLTPRSNSYQM